jgi:hypothetical protein
MGVRTICIPSSDAEFAEAVARSLAADDITTPDELEAALRPHYRGVRVRRRELSGEQGATWYVYRDGSFQAAMAPPRTG